MNEGVIIYKNAMFWTDNSGILYCKFNNKDSNTTLDYKTAKHYINAVVKLCNGKAMPFLIDVRDAKGTFSIAAAKLIAKNLELVKLRISEAFLINNIGVSLLITTYKRLYNPITPFGVFRELDIAKAYSMETKNQFYGSVEV
ncbi:hypothetical protein [Algibacter sp. PT7-4]|uniref:DUF7793 family protein n=1 Tax=Algibacter ulvanivorans TaxID=3400999 RepID=UPI003AADB768